MFWVDGSGSEHLKQFELTEKVNGLIPIILDYCKVRNKNDVINIRLKNH